MLAVLAELYRLDALGTGAFLPLAFGVGHFLAFTQFVETDALEADEWKNRSFAFPVSMNPKPLSVNLFIVPSAMCVSLTIVWIDAARLTIADGSPSIG